MSISSLPPSEKILKEWIDSQKLLETALAEFSKTTSAIKAAFDPLARHSKEAVAISTAIDRYTRQIIRNKDHLKNASNTLLTIRNESVPPINRLPEEILEYILCLTVDLSQPSDDFMRPPTMLCQVCRVWRDVTFATGSMWRYVTFDNVRDEGLRKARLAIERAGDSPLDISIRDVGTHYDTAIDNSDTIDEILSFYISRATSLSLDIQHAKLIPHFLGTWFNQGIPGTVRTLSVISHQYDYPPYNIIMYDFMRGQDFSVLKPVRELRLRNVFIPWEYPAFHDLLVLDLTNAYETEYPTLTELLQILAASPHLHTLRLRYSAITSEIPCTPVELRELRHLSLELATGLKDVLFGISWPIASRLHLSISSNKDHSYTKSFTNQWRMLYNSILRIGPQVDPSLLESILPRMRNVVTFAFDQRTFDEPMLTVLADANPNYPRFSTMEIGYCVITNQDAFRQMIMRYNLKQLKLIVCCFLEANAAGELVRVAANKQMDVCTWLAEVVPDFEIIDQCERLGLSKYSIVD